MSVSAHEGGFRDPTSQPAQRGLGLTEFGQAPVDFGEVLLDQVADVIAGGLSAVAQGESGAALGEGESGVLGIPD